MDLGKPVSAVNILPPSKMTLTLLPITPDMEFDCSNYDAVSTILMEVIESTLAMKIPPPWSGYLAMVEGKKVVGICAFKGPPDESKEVELAWFTFPPYENRGHGKQMAAELVRLALKSGEVQQLIAHTAPERDASTKICEACGFAFQGEIMHPEDGPVWLWRRGA